MNKICLSFLVFCIVSCQSQVNKSPDVIAANALANRVLGSQASEKIVFETLQVEDSKEVFEISTKEGKVLVKGSNAVAMASGLNWYLKYTNNNHISWEAEQLKGIDSLTLPEGILRKTSNFEYSYYLNYCTFNYSMAFWDWERWEKELDWMAMNGINLPLAIVGSEVIWKNTLQRLDFTPQEISDFIPGPAFNAWWLMGNLEGWGGPLSDAYINQQVTLQQKIITRMKSLGMQPVLPGFYGMVPTTLKNKFPKAKIDDQGLWAGGFQRPSFLSPVDPLFDKIAKIYYQELKKLYGDVSFFSGDPFHEGGHTKGIDLPLAGKRIIYGMKDSFPASTWVFQGWGGNPQKDLISAVKNEDILILDLDCDNRPQWEDRKGWEGKPWVWSMITNFGGNTGLFGRMDVLATEPFRALNHPEYSKNLKGIGAMMEGIENNSVMYELLFELKWRKKAPNLEAWISDYTKRRYGKENPQLNKAWDILRHTVFGQKLEKQRSQQGTSESILCARPALEIEQVSSWGTSKLYYNPADLLEAWKLFIEAEGTMPKSEGYEYDLVDVTRQVLANYSQELHAQVIKAYKENNNIKFQLLSEQFLELIDDQDQLLSSIEPLTLAKWLHDARAIATSPEEEDLFEFNARTQITTWSFKDSNLHEYAHREWAGLLSDFYKPRWRLFFDYLELKMRGQHPKEPDYFKFEAAWNQQNSKGYMPVLRDPIKESIRIYKKYKELLDDTYAK